MRAWITAVALALAAPAAAQDAAGVSVWLRLPRSAKSAEPSRDLAADALILKLLGPGAVKESSASDAGGLLLHYESAAWSPLIAPEERRADLSALAADWGPALRVEEASAGAPPLSAAAALGAAPKIPSRDAALGLLPDSLLAGGSAGFYDGFKPAKQSADPVFGREGAGLARLAPAAAPAVRSGATPEPPSPAATPAPAGPYAALIEKTARASGIEPALLRAVIEAKSGGQAGRAVAGAYGLMGVSARSAKAYGYTAKQVLDPEINLKVGSDMLADLLKEFGGDVHRALAAYQVGPEEVLRSGGIPNDRGVRDFMNAVERALGPAARAASLPVKTIRSPLKYAVQKDLIELAEQARKGGGVSRYRPLIEKLAAQFGVDPRLMEAMVMQEDPSGNPRAVSAAGAQGLAQLMPATAAELGIRDSFDPVESLRGMARHIQHLSRVFDGDPVLIAASYNAGEGVVERLGRVPRYRETMAYVRRVFNNYFALTDRKVDVGPYMPPPARARRVRAAR